MNPSLVTTSMEIDHLNAVHGGAMLLRFRPTLSRR
jgi:hypothetical protein